MAKKPTIYDVASLAGVSLTTVSRVLNSPDHVYSLSRDKIVKAMKELSFIPKAEAIVRARKDFKRIGVLTPFFTALSFIQRIRSIAEALSVTDYELITYSVASEEQLSAYLAMLPVSNRGVIKALQEENYRVPEDVAVIGFNIYNIPERSSDSSLMVIIFFACKVQELLL